jgi:hypothetical protein
MQMKKLGSMLVLVSACSASVDDGNGGDDGGGGDAGMVDEGGPGAGNDTVRFRLTAFRDERGDQIDFSTGEPVHTHAGSALALGGTDCPDVYKYAYLADTTAPKFGKETSPNPLAWKIEAKAAAEYRVRRGDESIVVDWRAVESSAIELHRDTVSSGKYLLDVRVGQAVATTCMIFHPLAAPIEQQPAEADASGLAGMTFAAGAPISQVLGPTSVRAFSQRFVHHTAEQVTLAIDVPQPTGTFVARAVNDFVVSRTGASGVLCSRDSDGFESGDPLCTDTSPVADPADQGASGVLASGTWTLQIVDEATGSAATECTISGLRATCQLPARAPTGAAKAYRIALSVQNIVQLAPSTTGPYAEHTLAGRTFTGRILETVQRCTQFKTTTKFGVTITTCETFADYTHFHALDQARIAFDAVPFQLAASPNPSLPPTPLAVNGVAPYVWDTGDADLPGPQ